MRRGLLALLCSLTFIASASAQEAPIVRMEIEPQLVSVGEPVELRSNACFRNRLRSHLSFPPLRRDGEILEITPATTVELGDDIAVVGYLHHLLTIQPRIGPEIHEPAIQDNPVESCRIVVLRSKTKRLSLQARKLNDRYGCFLAGIERLGVVVPVDPEMEFEPGDVLHITGHRAALDRVGEELGHVEREIDETDLVTFGLGIAAGTLLGTWSVTVAGIPVGFGTAGGIADRWPRDRLPAGAPPDVRPRSNGRAMGLHGTWAAHLHGRCRFARGLGALGHLGKFWGEPVRLRNSRHVGSRSGGLCLRSLGASHQSSFLAWWDHRFDDEWRRLGDREPRGGQLVAGTWLHGRLRNRERPTHDSGQRDPAFVAVIPVESTTWTVCSRRHLATRCRHPSVWRWGRKQGLQALISRMASRRASIRVAQRLWMH